MAKTSPTEATSGMVKQRNGQLSGTDKPVQPGLSWKDTGSRTNGEDKSIVIEDNAIIKMKQQVGLSSGVSFIVGTMIGSGIFISPKGVLRGTGSVGSPLLVWAGCGIIALCGALCFAELGTMIPLSGGEYTYLNEAYGPVPAFLSIWIVLVISRTGAQAVVSLTFAQYVLVPFFDECGPPEIAIKFLASAALLTVAVVNSVSAKLAARVQVLCTVVKVSALIVIIGGGIFKVASGNTEYISTGFEDSITNPSVVALAFYNGLFAYSGWNALNYLTEELVYPSKNLPRSIIIAVPLVTLIYIATNISYLTVLSKDMLLESPAVAISWAERALDSVALGIPIAVAFSTFGALNGAIFTGSRMCYAAARQGHISETLSYLHVERRTPSLALIVTTTCTLLMLIPGDVSTLINFFSFSTWIMYGLTFLGVIVMRFTRKDSPRPFKVPIVMPVAMVLISVYLLVAPIVQDPQIEFLYATLIILAGLCYYVPFVYFELRFKALDTFVTWVQLFMEVAPSKLELD